MARIELNDAQLRRLYVEEGLNDYEVAKIVRVGRYRLREWREGHEVASKTNKKGLDPAWCLELVKRLEGGETLTRIASETGVHRSSIAKLLKRNGYIYPRYRPAPPEWAQDYVLTARQEEILLGELFGDGGLWATSDRAAYYYCGHASKQREFVEWKAQEFAPLTSRTNELVDLGVCTMGTWTCEVLRAWRSEFYPTGKGHKMLTPEAAARLTPLALAVWYMGDGSKNRNTAVFHVGLQIDLEPIAPVVSEVFGLEFSARRYEKEWHLRVMEPEKFWPIVGPSILPSMAYKLPEGSHRENMRNGV